LTELLKRLSIFPLFLPSLALIAGVMLADSLTLPAYVWLISSVSALLVSGLFVLLRNKIPLPYAWLVMASFGAFFLGAARYQSQVPDIDASHIAWYNDLEYDLLVTGRLDAPPDYRDTYTNLRINVEALDTGSGDLPVEGLLLARVFPNETYRYGERIRLRGRLLTPPENEDFSFRDYLARQGIHASMNNSEVTRLPGTGGNPIFRWVYTFKEKALGNIYRIFPDPEASLLAGILLGVDTGLSRDLQQAFKDTGTAHIIAISGFNIAIIAGLFITLFSRVLGQTRGAITAVIGILVYTFLVGADAAVVRAAIMGTLSILARLFGRRNTGLNALVITALVMTFINPNIPWDVGFQLSFFATLGLILYAEPFQHWAVNRITRFTNPGLAQKLAGPVSEYILFTLAAQLTTLPIMAYHFKQISLISLIANPFILPAQPAVMILGGLALLFSLVWIPLGAIAALVAWPFAAYTIRVVELFDRVPNGVISLGNFSLTFVIVFYLVLLSWTFARHQIKDYFKAQREELPTLPTAITATVLLVLVAAVWRAVYSVPDGRLHITFLDVGTADAILIETPQGGHLLINGGPSTSLLSDGLGRRVPSLDRELDWLIIASTQENQLSALPRVVQRIPPKNVLWSGNVEASYAARTLRRWFIDQDIPVVQAETGMQIDLGEGATISVLNVNPRGAVLLVEWNAFRALLPVGMNFTALEELSMGEDVGPVNLLLIADSGYAPVNPPEWLATLAPEILVLSVEAGDKDGLPQEEIQALLEEHPGLRTDYHGWIHVATNGERVWIDVQKQPQALEEIEEPASFRK
jgi:competence protein ComEC